MFLCLLLQSTRRDMKEHMEHYGLYHAQIQAEGFMDLKQITEKNSHSLQHLLERANSLEVRVTTIEKTQSNLDQKIETFDERRDRVIRNESKLEHLEIQDMKKTADMVELGHKVEELQMEFNMAKSTSFGNTGLTSGYGTADYSHSANVGASSNSSQSIVTPLGPDFTTRTPYGNTVVASNQRIESIHSRLVELEHSVDRSLSSCLDQELRIQLLERATYNGILLWKVDEFERRRKEAKEGVTMSLYSTPFYTGRHGYKMCARIYLNGDGLGKNTHMSFFFVVMRGPIDELLPWPFKQKVTFTLINQMGKKHVTDSFRPDPNSSSFQRPGRREMNIASGCPMFIRLEHLLEGGFVKDDCIYLRVMVDTVDIPKILP